MSCPGDRDLPCDKRILNKHGEICFKASTASRVRNCLQQDRRDLWAASAHGCRTRETFAYRCFHLLERQREGSGRWNAEQKPGVGSQCEVQCSELRGVR